MLVVKGVYDGHIVRLLEPIQINGPHRVAVTFLEPVAKDMPTADEDNLERFVGMWADFTLEEEQVFQTVLEERAGYFAGRDLLFEGGESPE